MTRNPEMQSLQPILTAHLFPKIESHLISLLSSLSADDWEKQTYAPKWKVKDVAAHLLDTQLRKLSMCRDRHEPKRPAIKHREELVSLINQLNEEGVRVYGRLSPQILISLMESVSAQSAKFHQQLDPFAEAKFAVSWAGEDKSLNWFDTAREFTERWHHQQQIRDAVNRPGIMTRELYFPVLDCFMRALPFAYREKGAEAEEGALLQFNISGECGGSWYLLHESAHWRLIAQAFGKKRAETTIPQEIAWRIFTKGIEARDAKSQISVEGETNLGLHVLKMISIVG